MGLRSTGGQGRERSRRKITIIREDFPWEVNLERGIIQHQGRNRQNLIRSRRRKMEAKEGGSLARSGGPRMRPLEDSPECQVGGWEVRMK